MEFISLQYLIFLPAFFACYWALRKWITARNLLTIAGSWYFYAVAGYQLLLLLVGFSICSYFSGLFICRTKSPITKKIILTAACSLFSGVLITYKYLDFFASGFAKILSGFGFDAGWTTLNLILPIGISFYTFQALGYVIDVYRSKIEPCRNIIPFLAFMSFFPQLVAGPIERAENMLPQFTAVHKFSYAEGVGGMKRILWGLVKKMIIADNCAIAVNQIFAVSYKLDGFNLAMGAILFTVQIYCDFSGYSDIAIGSARLLGIKLSENFRYPYFATSIRDFWRRWHITLTSWFRDYVYYPLGGSKVPLPTVIINVMVVFILSGLWHGASNTFILWGFLNGIAVALCIVFKKHSQTVFKSNKALTLTELRVSSRFKTILTAVMTGMFVTAGWVIFRSASVRGALSHIWRIPTSRWTGEPIFDRMWPLLIYITVFFAIEWLGRKHECPLYLPHKGIFKLQATRWMFYIFLTTAVILLSGSASTFIYFQF